MDVLGRFRRGFRHRRARDALHGARRAGSASRIYRLNQSALQRSNGNGDGRMSKPHICTSKTRKAGRPDQRTTFHSCDGGRFRETQTTMASTEHRAANRAILRHCSRQPIRSAHKSEVCGRRYSVWHQQGRHWQDDHGAQPGSEEVWIETSKSRGNATGRRSRCCQRKPLNATLVDNWLLKSIIQPSCRIDCGWKAFFKFKTRCNRTLPIKHWLKFFEAVLTPCVLYACGTWTLTANSERKLRSIQRRMLRWMVWVEYIRRATHRSEQLAFGAGVSERVSLQRARKFELAGKTVNN